MFSVEHACFLHGCSHDGGGEEEGGGNMLPVQYLNKLWNFHKYWLVNH